MSKAIDISLAQSEAVQQRFWSKVDKSMGADACWLWTAGKHSVGYGSFMVTKKTRDYLAHRIAYAIHYGVDPGELFVCHHCDNPQCVNPLHMFLGTDQDNKADMVRKGRQGAARGANNPQSKFTNNQVMAIREKFSTGNVTCLEIATDHGVDEKTISDIVRGVTYRAAGGPLSSPKSLRRGSGHPKATITENMVFAIRQMKKSGMKHNDIAHSIGCSVHVVHDVVRGKTWTYVK